MNIVQYPDVRPPVTQQTLVQLDASRPALGLILDQTAALRAEPAFGSSVSRVGGALELRWRAAYRRAEEELLHCRKLQDAWSRWVIGYWSE